MNWNFSAWSIRNPVPPILLFAVLLLMGVQSFNRLPITQFPNIDVPLIVVSVGQSGAAPAELESQITKRVEDAVSGLAGVKNVVSTMLRKSVAASPVALMSRSSRRLMSKVLRSKPML
jgi:multidrug efflux pump subunit AcrB